MTGLFEWLSKVLGQGSERSHRSEHEPVPSFEELQGEAEREHEEEPAPGVRFDPNLIEHLKHEHRLFLKSYAAIKTAASEGQWDLVYSDLLSFRAGLTNHLLTESVKLYVYLRLKLAADPVQLRLMRNFSSEMVGIGKVVVDFIENNEDITTNSEKQRQFMSGWNDIGKVLGDRIGREEKTLYPMYEDMIDQSAATATAAHKTGARVN